MVFAFGVWVVGGVIAQDFRVSMALTAVWFAVTFAAVVALGRARRPLLVPAVGGYVVAAGLIGGYLAWSTLHDRVVHERVAVGVPATRVSAPASSPPRANVLESAGSFVSGEHATSGTARVVRLRSGRRVVTLTGFSTSSGPDLRVRAAPGNGTDGSSDGVVDLGALKGNRGDQQYDLPASVDPRRSTVLIWCRAFDALFGSARLRAA